MSLRINPDVAGRWKHKAVEETDADQGSWNTAMEFSISIFPAAQKEPPA